MGERPLQTPAGAETFRAPGRIILTKEPQSVFIDSRGARRRPKPGSPHSDEFPEPPKAERLASLRSAIPQLFAPNDPAPLGEILEAFGVTQSEVEGETRAYVSDVLSSAETPEAAFDAWQGLLSPFFDETRKNARNRDREGVNRVRQNPLLHAVIDARANLDEMKQLRFVEVGIVESGMKGEQRDDVEGKGRGQFANVRKLRAQLHVLFHPESRQTTASLVEEFGISDSAVRRNANQFLIEKVEDIRRAAGESEDPGVIGALELLKEQYIRGAQGEEGMGEKHPMLLAINRALQKGQLPPKIDLGMAIEGNNYVILMLWDKMSPDDLVALTGLSRGSVISYASQLRRSGYELETKAGGNRPRRPRPEAETAHLRAEIIRRWGQPNKRIAAALGMSRRRFERFVARMRADGIDLADKAGGSTAMLKREVRSSPDAPASELAARLGISVGKVEAIRSGPEPHEPTTDKPEIEELRQVLARGFTVREAAAILEVSYKKVRSWTDQIPRAEKRAMGVGPGRRRPPSQEEWADRLRALDELGIYPKEAIERLVAEGTAVPTEIVKRAADMPRPERKPGPGTVHANDPRSPSQKFGDVASATVFESGADTTHGTQQGEQTVFRAGNLGGDIDPLEEDVPLAQRHAAWRAAAPEPRDRTKRQGK